MALVVCLVIMIPGVLIFIGTPGRLDSGNINTLSNTVDFRGKALEARMVQWSDLSSWIEQAEQITQSVEEDTGALISEQITDSRFRRRLLDEYADSVLKNLERMRTTGAFIMLSDGGENKVVDAVYLRDSNPQSVSENHYDILVEAGLGKEYASQGFILDYFWTEKLVLPPKRDFFDAPMQAAAAYPDMSTAALGYWSSMVQMREKDIPVMTYTVPLRDSAGTAYGVIGIEIDAGYLDRYLNNDEISIDKQSGYYLGRKLSAESDTYETVYVNSSYYKSRIDRDSLVQIVPKNQQNIYRITGEYVTEETVCSMVPLSLYQNNTPFEEEQWILCGIVQERQLYKESQRFMAALVIAMLVSFVFAIVIAVAAVSQMFRPIWAMMEKIKDGGNVPGQIPQTHILEIDKLAEEIEHLRRSAYEAGSKVADIIEISNMQLGIYEISQTMPECIFCTKRFFKLTELPMDGWQDNYMPKEQFEQLLAVFHKKCVPMEENENIFSFETADGHRRYLECKKESIGEDELCLYLDVTARIMETEKIKHERDYDILTDLYNRRAFSRIVSDLVNNQKIQTGVMSMWDLDNLKFFNDTYGHEMGDRYICMMADAFGSVTFEHAVAARISGDEFMLFLYDGPVEEMCRVIETVHAGFTEKQVELPNGGSAKVSVSAGIAVYGQDADTYDELVHLADFAMYEIKHGKKSGVGYFDRSIYDHVACSLKEKQTAGEE